MRDTGQDARPTLDTAPPGPPTGARDEMLVGRDHTPEGVLLLVFLHLRSIASRPCGCPHAHCSAHRGLQEIRQACDALHLVAHDLVSTEGLDRAAGEIGRSGAEASTVALLRTLLTPPTAAG